MEGRLRIRLLLVVGALGVTTVVATPAAQYSEPSLATRFASGWENDRFRVRPVSLAPGAQAPSQGEADAVLVSLTADLEGRMPAGPATWRPAGTGDLQNRGRARFDGLLIELKPATSGAAGVTPPEALPAGGHIDVRLLIDNPRVTVTSQRYLPGAVFSAAWHVHPQDALIVNLTAGHTWPAYGESGPMRVRRGEIDILPANTLHAFGNAGSDPLEFLAIFPK
jgi:quercetin dioxygenase-like cupin family protein